MLTCQDSAIDYINARPLRIGLVTETFPPEINGVAMTLNRLARGLNDLDHEIEVYRPKTPDIKHAINNSRIKQILMPGMPIPVYREMSFGFPAGRFFRKQWNGTRPDILYVATEGPLGYSAIHSARKLGIPVVSGFHTNFHKYSSHYRMGWFAPVIMAYLRKLHNNTQYTLVPTRALAIELEYHDFNNVTVMQRGVDTELFSPSRRSDDLRRQWQAGDDEIVCIYVGRIAAEKNIHQAIETVKAASAQCKVRFVLVGDGPLREKLQQEHPEFIFCGTHQGESLAQHYASADVMLFPSRTETFGNVVTEAMASGLAVVAYDEAAAHEHITDGQNGAIATASYDNDFTFRTIQLCRQKDTIKRLGKNASAYCTALGWPMIVNQFETILRKAMQVHSSATGNGCSQEAPS